MVAAFIISTTLLGRPASPETVMTSTSTVTSSSSHGSQSVAWRSEVTGGATSATGAAKPKDDGTCGFSLHIQTKQGAWDLKLSESPLSGHRYEFAYVASLAGRQVKKGTVKGIQTQDLFFHLAGTRAKPVVILDRKAADGHRQPGDVYAHVSVQVSSRPNQPMMTATSTARAMGFPAAEYKYRISAPDKTLYEGHKAVQGEPREVIPLGGEGILADGIEIFPTRFADGVLTCTACLTIGGVPYFCPNVKLEGGKTVCILYPEMQHQGVAGQDAVHADGAEPKVGFDLKPKKHQIMLELSADIKKS